MMMKNSRRISNIRMGGVNMSDKIKLPEVMVFAGPNGSGKSTITRMARTVGEYINADDIKKNSNSPMAYIYKFIRVNK